MPIISGVKTDAITIGRSNTDSQNFQLSAGNDGSAKLSRGSDGSLGDILTVASDGKVTFTNKAIFSANPAISTGRFTSAEQTISSGGTLTIAHGLGVVPFTTTFQLICKTAEAGYSINDVAIYNIQSSTSASDNLGMSVKVDSTNISIKFGANASPIIIVNASTGVGANATNANWRLIVKAEA